MVGKITSRNAGGVLARVVALLLLPMVVLGYLFANESQKAISILKSEINGLQLIDAAMPHLLENGQWQARELTPDLLALERQVAPDLREKGLADIAEHHGVEEGSDDVVDGTHLQNETDKHKEDVNNYIRTIASKSGLKLDSDGESYFVVESLVGNLPDFISDYFDVIETMETSLSRGQISDAQIDDMLLHAGAAREALERLDETLQSALSFSTNADVFDKLETQIRIARLEFGRMGVVLSSSRGVNGNSALKAYVADQAGQLRFLESTRNFWLLGSAHLDSLLKKRLSTHQRYFLLLMALAVLCALIAIAYGVRMFTTQLTKLDEVDRAREVAEAARVDAERMAGELIALNDGMASLNKELSDNLSRLKDAQDELLKKGRMEQLGQLTATIAHELRNPLGSVRTSTFLLERKVKDKGLGVETQIDRINKGVVRCDNIITQLLDFSRTKKLSPRPEFLDDWLAKTVEECAKTVNPHVAIECHLGLEGVQVPFDGARMERAVLNLMNNAAEAMVGNFEDKPNDPNRNSRLVISTARSDGYAKIVFEDNGPGMNHEVLGKVREPLFTTKSFGTGLGIPAIEQIAHQHDGRLEITSTVGVGSKFTIFLPLILRAEAA